MCEVVEDGYVAHKEGGKGIQLVDRFGVDLLAGEKEGKTARSVVLAKITVSSCKR